MSTGEETKHVKTYLCKEISWIRNSSITLYVYFTISISNTACDRLEVSFQPENDKRAFVTINNFSYAPIRVCRLTKHGAIVILYLHIEVVVPNAQKYRKTEKIQKTLSELLFEYPRVVKMLQKLT